MFDPVGADIGVANGVGNRAKKIYASITMKTRRVILSELPFGNVVFKLGLTGAQVWDTLENVVSQFESNAGRFLRFPELVLYTILKLKQDRGSFL